MHVSIAVVRMARTKIRGRTWRLRCARDGHRRRHVLAVPQADRWMGEDRGGNDKQSREDDSGPIASTGNGFSNTPLRLLGASLIFSQPVRILFLVPLQVCYRGKHFYDTHSPCAAYRSYRVSRRN